MWVVQWPVYVGGTHWTVAKRLEHPNQVLKLVEEEGLDDVAHLDAGHAGSHQFELAAVGQTHQKGERCSA